MKSNNKAIVFKALGIFAATFLMVGLSAADLPWLGLVVFVAAMAALAWDVNLARPIHIEVKCPHHSESEEHQDMPEIKPSKVVEATEQRMEHADGSAIQVRRIRQWN